MSVLSCNDVRDIQGTDMGSPLSECVLPAVMQAGEEALIQWNGFTQDSRLSLVSESGQEYEVSVKVVTASGIMCIVPIDVPAGFYIVAVDDNGRKELGRVEVIAADMPVIGLKIPSGAVAGNEIIIEGIGFEEGCSVVLTDADGKECIVQATVISSGISILVPADLLPGDYVVYLQQDGARWLVSSLFSVYAGGARTLKRIDYLTPYTGEAMLRLSWEIDRTDPVTLTLTEYLVEGSEETVQAYDRYECDENGYFELTVDGFESSNDLGVTYIRDENGMVTGSDVLIYGNNKPTSFTWTYDAEGYLLDISSPSRSFRTLAYDRGNLTSFRTSGFSYDAPGLANHPSAPDVVWAYMALMEQNDPFVYIPYLLGWYTKASASLPTGMILPSPTGTGTINHSLDYEFDESGYVVKMMWASSSIGFVFE
jgi:hypothetical protein